jgi:hypothetical protein
MVRRLASAAFVVLAKAQERIQKIRDEIAAGAKSGTTSTPA